MSHTTPMDHRKLAKAVEEGKSIRKLADHFDISPTTVRYWLKKYKLKTKVRKVELQEGEKYCPACDSVKSTQDFYQRRNRRGTSGWCKECSCQAASRRQKETKEKAVEYKGGSCKRCGYNRYLGALEFHHVDPAKKDPSWNHMKMWSFERIKEELDKCVLLCSNCHREAHGGIDC